MRSRDDAGEARLRHVAYFMGSRHIEFPGEAWLIRLVSDRKPRATKEHIPVRKTLRVPGILVAGSVVMVLAPGGVAHAKPSKEAPGIMVVSAQVIPAKAGGTAPACVHRRVRHLWVAVTNKCGKTMRVRVIIKRGKDSPCWRLRPNKKKHWLPTPKEHAVYQKTITC